MGILVFFSSIHSLFHHSILPTKQCNGNLKYSSKHGNTYYSSIQFLSNSNSLQPYSIQRTKRAGKLCNQFIQT